MLLPVLKHTICASISAVFAFSFPPNNRGLGPFWGGVGGAGTHQERVSWLSCVQGHVLGCCSDSTSISCRQALGHRTAAVYAVALVPSQSARFSFSWLVLVGLEGNLYGQRIVLEVVLPFVGC